MKKVNLNDVCRDFGIRHIPYAKYWENLEELPPVAERAAGLTFYEDGVPIILYDDRKPPNQIRFTVAHELGHLFLKHVKGEPAEEELKERWSRISYPRMEREADLFAVILLAHDFLCQYGGLTKGELAEDLKERWSRISYPRMEREADLFAVILLAHDFLCQYGGLTKNEEEKSRMKKASLNKICRGFGIRYVPYTNYWDELPPEAEQTDGMTLCMEGGPVILYDDRKPPNRIRFVVAHELGHIMLGHLGERREFWEQNRADADREADLFAATLVASDIVHKCGEDQD